MTEVPGHWRQCSSCRTPIAFDGAYYACSISTCNRGRTALYFCSLACWEAHLPMMRHRDAWAEEARAPTREAWERAQQDQTPDDASTVGTPVAARRIVTQGIDPIDASAGTEDVLVVVSKLKHYVRARSGMSTSDGVIAVLSDHLRRLCSEAIRNAGRDGRRTVMERDFLPLVRPPRRPED
jgi:hypothetical protein